LPDDGGDDGDGDAHDGEADDRPPPQSSEAPQPAGVLSYATPSAAPPKLTTIRRLSGFEASLAAAKLESAGVRAFVADENIATAHPLLVSAVRLQVLDVDVDRAEQVLGAWPPPAHAGGPRNPDDDDDDDAAGEYVEEAYRCPKCHRKAVDLLPPSSGLRTLRLGCLAMLVIPGLLMLVLPSVVESSPPLVTLGWMAVLAVLSFTVLTAKRSKRCRDCGHVWGDPAQPAADSA
jgi:hypothetical protein